MNTNSQKYTSEKTSVNIVAKVFNKVEFKEGSTVLDYGGGKYNKTKNYVEDKYNVKFIIFDPYNRPKEDNNKVLDYTYDYVTCCNVLNVIYEESVILDILEGLKNLHNGKEEIYIQIYEGDRKGLGKVTTKGYQRNQKSDEYIKYIEVVFGKDYVVTRKSNIYTLKNRGGS